MENVQSNKQYKGIIITGLAAALSFIVVLIIDGLFPFGKGSIAALDLYSQYAPLLYRFYDVIGQVKAFSMDFNIGGGINLYSDTLTEVLNPFNYVLLLFGRAYIYKALNLLLMLYVCASSMSAYYALSKLFSKNKLYINVTLSLAYGMSYFVAYQYEIIRWMYLVFLFPFVFLSIRRFIDNGKPLWFILLHAYILILSLQFGIQLCIFSFVYITCEMLAKNGWKIKMLSPKACLRTGLSYIAIIMLSGISTSVAVVNLMNSARSMQNSSILTVVMHHGLDNILERIFEISSPVVCGIVIAAIIVLKKDALKVLKDNMGLVICYLIMLITVVFEPSNLMWHLGSYQCFPVRYGYIVLWMSILISLKLIDATYEVIKNDKSVDAVNIIKMRMVSVVCLCIITACAVYINASKLSFAQAFATLDISNVCLKETLILYVISMVVAVCVAIAFRFALSDNKICNYIVVAMSAIASIIWFIAILLPQSSLARVSNENAYSQMNDMYEKAIVSTYAGRERQNEVWTYNSGLITGKNQISAYVPSGEGNEFVYAMSELGYETPWVSVTENGGSNSSDRMLGFGSSYMKAMLVSYDEFDAIESIVDVDMLIDKRTSYDFVLDNKKGSINISFDKPQSGVVLLPMAYIKGWSSKQGDVIKYLDGFMAVKIDNVDTVQLDFMPPGMIAGILVSVIGVILTLIVLLLEKSTKEGLLGIIARFVYIAVIAVFIVVIYILPNLGMFVFMGAKVFGKDLSPYIVSSQTEVNDNPVLLSQSMQDDGLHVVVGRNNLTLNKNAKIFASDEESKEFKALLAVDGKRDKASRWSSENNWDNNEHFLQLDLGSEQKIKAVNICWERTNACQYTIEISNDKKSWEVINSFDAPAMDKNQTIYYDKTVSARYVRLHVYDVTKNEEDLSLYYQNISVCEFEVYGEESDSFVINTPVLTKGVNRQIPIPEVPYGYSLSVGGINYNNIQQNSAFIDTLAPVDINLGYVLSCENVDWDLDGFDISLPASSGKEYEAFPYKSVSVREWAGNTQVLDLTSQREIVKAIEDKTDDKLISVDIDSKLYSYLGDEGYEIDIDKDAISILAATNKGLAWARTTLKLMVSENSEYIPCGIIRDYPEYEVRGFVLDVARRPISIEFLYRIVEAMSDNYMNTLQLHLNDNAIIYESNYDGTVDGARKLYSAFRLESEVCSDKGRLTSEDFYYSSKELVKLIADAKKLGVNIVPEIDTPAHSMAITAIMPNLGYNSNPEMAATLDVSKKETVDLVKNLWSEYLAEDALFEECDVIHLGLDEYFGDNEAFGKYVSEITQFVRDKASDKTLRIWANMDYNELDTSELSSDIEVMVWNPQWSDPYKAYQDGYKVINCLNKHLYIIVDGGNDRLDVDDLKDNWLPNNFSDEDYNQTIPEWSPKMLGACYSMWNDNYCKEGIGPDEDGLYDRFIEPIRIISGKLWNR